MWKSVKEKEIKKKLIPWRLDLKSRTWCKCPFFLKDNFIILSGDIFILKKWHEKRNRKDHDIISQNLKTNLPKYFVDRKIPDWANFYCQRVYVVYVIINITTSLLYTFPFRWPITKKKKKKAKYTITYLCTRLD